MPNKEHLGDMRRNMTSTGFKTKSLELFEHYWEGQECSKSLEIFV